MSKTIKRINTKAGNNDNYVRLKLTFTSRVIAGWAITTVGLIKLWISSDPTAWLPVVLGGTAMMIVSRGVDHYMTNQNEAITEKYEVQKSEFQNSFQHQNLNNNQNTESEALKKHKEYHSYLNV